MIESCDQFEFIRYFLKTFFLAALPAGSSRWAAERVFEQVTAARALILPIHSHIARLPSSAAHLLTR